MDNCGKSATGESVRIRRKHVKRLHANLDKISLFFGVKLVENDIGGDEGLSSPGDGCPSQYVQFQIVPLLKATSPERSQASETASSAELQVEKIQNVTRIASAPDPSRPWHGGPPPASSSEPQIWPPQLTANQQQQQQQQQHHLQQDQRRRLHYHLASIFPEDQVQTVMQMYPEETNPQKICAAILNMYPKM